jgi:hypothetical protein
MILIEIAELVKLFLIFCVVSAIFNWLREGDEG